MKCLNPLNNVFHCLANGGAGLGGRGCQNVPLNQSCRKFDEMLKSAKNVFFFTVWPIGEGGLG